MKKTFIMLSTVAVVFLMVSTATAIPQSNSTPVMNAIDQIEDTEETLATTFQGPSGALGKIIDLIKLLIDLIMSLVSIIQNIIGIIALIQAVINGITLVLDLLQQIMDLINNPSATV